MLNFRDIKQNIFINYYKYWIILIFILIIYFFYNYRVYHFHTNKIPKNIENAIYVGSGIVINKHNILVNKDLIENSCVGKYSGLGGKIFAIDKKNIFRVVSIKSNSILNISVLGTKRNEDTFSSYALFNLNNYDYKDNETIIVPKTLNKGGYFEFKEGKVSQIDDNDQSNFFVSVKNTSKKEALYGMPIFNENYILLGVIKDINKNINNETKKEKILNESSVQKTYSVNGIEIIKNFLNEINIPYFMVSGSFSSGKEKYDIENSLVDIICIERY